MTQQQQDAELRASLDFALEACCEAGGIVCDARRESDPDVLTKAGFELVTKTDIAIDAFFRKALSERFPDDAILSEEGSHDPGEDGARTWIIDPLDGTANFVNGHDHVAISVALAMDGQTQIGVVHAPLRNETFWAIRGKGAFRNGQPIRVSGLTDPKRALIAVGFPHERGEIDDLVDRLKPLLREFGDIRRLAAPALDICWVADGRLAGFFDRIHIWDVAAAGLIAHEAGAEIFSPGPGRSGAGADYLIATPAIMPRLRELFG